MKEASNCLAGSKAAGSSAARISAVIMASGLSKRMNADKLHLELGGKYLYEYILDTAQLYPFYEVLVAAKDDDILARAQELGFIGIRNTRSHIGQSESIKAALHVSRPADGYMFFVADQPFLRLDTIQKLCSTFEKDPCRIVVPFFSGKRGSPVIFPVSLKEQLLSLEGDQGGRAVMQENLRLITSVDIVSDWEQFDVDLPEDYERIGKLRIDRLTAK